MQEEEINIRNAMNIFGHCIKHLKDP